MTYSSVDSLFESDNKEIYYLGYEAKFFNTLGSGKFLYDTAEKAGILEEVAGNAKYYVRDGALKKFLKK